MSTARPTEEPTQPIKCPRCGSEPVYLNTPCPTCGYIDPQATQMKRPPFTLPLQSFSPNVLGDEMQVILQFLPSGVCFTLPMQSPLIMGRITSEPPEIESLNISSLNAYRHGVSNWHCRLERREQRLIVTDLNSTNGTYLNGERIPGGTEYVVQDGAELILGTLRLSVFFRVVG